MGSIMQEWRVLLEGLPLSVSCSCSCPLVHWQQEGWVSERTERRRAALLSLVQKKSENESTVRSPLSELPDNVPQPLVSYIFLGSG